MQSSSELEKPSTIKSDFNVGQRVHSAGDCRRVGTVKYIGRVEGYKGDWVGIDWDNDDDGKHDGSVNGVRYFQANAPKSASFVRPHNLSPGISLLHALQLRYATASTREEEDEMYVLSASKQRVPIHLLGKDKIEDKLGRFEELTGASVSYLGISSSEDPCEISQTLPNLKELDLSGNLLCRWQDVEAICRGLPALAALNLSSNIMSHDIVGMSQLKNLRILVLNNTGISWVQVEVFKDSLLVIEELHLMANKLREITPTSSTKVQGFDFLRLLNLEYNHLVDWGEILKLSQLRSLEQLHLNNNKIEHIWHPDDGTPHELGKSYEPLDKSSRPFQNLRCLLLGGNNIGDLPSIDSLNCYPSLMDVRLSENPITDTGRGGIPRFILIARLAKIEILNGSEITRRERKDSEIRYVRQVMSKSHCNLEEIKRLHPRFTELKAYHGIEDERPSNGSAAVTLKCTGPSMGEKPSLTKKLPATTTVGKLKILCQSFFKLKSIKPVLFLQEEGSPLPSLLEDDMGSLMDVGVGDGSTILVDEES